MGCVKCKLALQGLAAYLLNGLQRSSSLQSRHKQSWRLLILILCKITKQNIHLRHTVCFVCHPVNKHTPIANFSRALSTS